MKKLLIITILFIPAVLFGRVTEIDWNDSIKATEMFRQFVSELNQQSDSIIRQHLIESVVKKAKGDNEDKLADIAENYLLTRHSKDRNPLLYTEFVKYMVANDYESSFRLQAMADLAMKCAPGTDAPDFEVILRDGSSHSFKELIDGKRTLLIFYDPDCLHCLETIAELKENSPDINIAAIYSGDEEEVWQTFDLIPSSWIDGRDSGEVFDSELYPIPETPTLYIISADGKIEANDITLEYIYP